ncbi:MAG: ABC transporter ATP-binding protein [Snowella sp.]|jgi:lipopolysaccharide transport system ATP-binding protein|nr:MAG: ABC transporter ATP-binding protein [Snowella sp.]
MSDTIIQVENLSKKYIIGHQQQGRYTALRDVLANSTKSLLKNIHNPKFKAHNSQKEDFWALKDVSFEIKQGDRVGIIGRNGAGKSTLLKILSRIVEPTTGRIGMKGRVSSLLEVGTGFHPELTGRENIYLNGAVLGMSKKEITRKFDEIVVFSEVEKFLDTPVKRYSSGMYVRLAFAVAAHLEPEILILDEVLAVGDTEFRKKCLGKMEDVSKEGRTVLFVSHDMVSIRSLCNQAYLLSSGQITAYGAADKVIDHYLESTKNSMLNEVPLEKRTDRSGDGSVRIISFQIEDADGKPVISSNSRLKLTIGYSSDNSIIRPQFSATIYDYDREIGIISLHSGFAEGLPNKIPNAGYITCVTEPLCITPGRCYINLSILNAGVIADAIQYAMYFDIESSDIYGTAKIQDRAWVICTRYQKWSSCEMYT